VSRPCLRVRAPAIFMTAATTVSCAKLKEGGSVVVVGVSRPQKLKRFFGAWESQSGKVYARTEGVPDHLTYRW
jgi:hypothetical protein